MTIAPELAVLALNLAVIVVAYFSFYPKLAGGDINKIGFFDLITSGFALFVVGTHYWGSDEVFNLVVMEVNWFWFTLATYAALETPILLWYLKKYKTKPSI